MTINEIIRRQDALEKRVSDQGKQIKKLEDEISSMKSRKTSKK